MYSECVCPDEINNDSPYEITSLLKKRYNGTFQLGGIAGLPYTGETGWNAFSSHCPKNGNIVVLIASHVGINSNGEIGNVLRHGHDHPTPACAGAQKAYESVKNNPANG